MAMSARTACDGEPMMDMNTTPLIDVLLVLLVMFIITVPLMTHSTTLQVAAGAGPATFPEPVVVGIDFDGTLSWNGAQVDDFAQLEQLLRSEAGQARQADLQVRPDRRAQYDAVARVLALAQRSGMQRIGVSGVADD